MANRWFRALARRNLFTMTVKVPEHSKGALQGYVVSKPDRLGKTYVKSSLEIFYVNQFPSLPFPTADTAASDQT